MSAGFIKYVLGMLRVIGVGFQLVVLGISCPGKVVALKANEKLDYDIRGKMVYIVALTITEMPRAANRGTERADHLGALSAIM